MRKKRTKASKLENDKQVPLVTVKEMSKVLNNVGMAQSRQEHDLVQDVVVLSEGGENHAVTTDAERAANELQYLDSLRICERNKTNVVPDFRTAPFFQSLVESSIPNT